ncbi:MAG: hypothetical protein ABSA18_06015 [Dehalococcoidia bacterium]|jgi:hypothetical protein
MTDEQLRNFIENDRVRVTGTGSRKAPRHRYGEYRRVRLTPEHFYRLVDELGIRETVKRIGFLDWAIHTHHLAKNEYGHRSALISRTKSMYLTMVRNKKFLSLYQEYQTDRSFHQDALGRCSFREPAPLGGYKIIIGNKKHTEIGVSDFRLGDFIWTKINSDMDLIFRQSTGEEFIWSKLTADGAVIFRNMGTDEEVVAQEGTGIVIFTQISSGEDFALLPIINDVELEKMSTMERFVVQDHRLVPSDEYYIPDYNSIPSDNCDDR